MRNNPAFLKDYQWRKLIRAWCKSGWKLSAAHVVVDTVTAAVAVAAEDAGKYVTVNPTTHAVATDTVRLISHRCSRSTLAPEVDGAAVAGAAT
jgi:hypothetical protein